MSTRDASLARARAEHDAQGILDHIPYTRWLGIRVSGEEDGNPVFTLPARDELVGNASLPAIHGGAVGALMEAAAIVTVLVQEQQSRMPKPIDFSLDYLRSARAEDLHASCQVLRQGRRVAAVRVDCWQRSRDTLTATGRAHLLLSAAD